jgi:hypothetical protein
MNYRVLLIVAILAATSGCSSTIAWPTWCRPGWIDQQRNRAERFDPYPTVDFNQGMYGTRPLDFQVPRSEAQQIQNGRTFYRRYGQLPSLRQPR